MKTLSPKSTDLKPIENIEHLASLPVTQLKGVGAKLAEKLGRLGIETLQDLLFHLPLRYIDKTRLYPIGGLMPGMDAFIEGTIVSNQIAYGKKRSLFCRLRDNSGSIGLRFYHFPASIKNQLTVGTDIRCFGEARRGASGLEIYHPEFELLKTDQKPPLPTELTPVYPSTEGLHANRIRQLCAQALEYLARTTVDDWLPPEILNTFSPPLPDLKTALTHLHLPKTPDNIDDWMQQRDQGKLPAQIRLAFEELLSHHLALVHIKDHLQHFEGIALPLQGELIQTFKKQLPFPFTRAQERVSKEISHDLSRTKPMMRLVQGDVGSGKTVVAATASLQAIAQGYQVALMAPTEILAEQHYQNFRLWFEPLGLKVSWLSGKLTAKRRRGFLEDIALGLSHITVGTHALFQDDVHFNKLALVIIDEQHRFGVNQRLKLTEKGWNQRPPHQLVMTATPIPRTLAMSAYADLDCSVIDELPPGRTPVKTVVISNHRRSEVISRVQQACSQGRQVYWVCTLIEESDSLQCEAAEDTENLLRQEMPDLSIGLIHGRLSPAAKVEQMDHFKEGTLDLLVATTVIEVGVNVPNASVMVIENPERLGLAQLHQLRGRVGRGSTESFCVLMYNPPLSETGKKRLNVMRSTTDGFIIAEEDLAIRGPGDVLGTRQTGLMQMKIADLQRDAHLLSKVHEAAQYLKTHHPNAIPYLIRRWVGEASQYAQV